MSESFAELFEQSLKTSKIAPGGLIVGEVMRIENDRVIVDAGLKSEGIIPLEQFRDGQGELTVKVGDRVDVVLEYMENGHGETQLSREKAQRARAWDDTTGRLLALTLDVSGASAQGLGLLIVGGPAATPVPLPGSTCSLVLDLGAAQGLFPFITDAQGDASLTFRVPPRPLTTDFQAVVLGVGRGSTLGATNGLNLVCR